MGVPPTDRDHGPPSDYDRVLYGGASFPQTHPARLSTVAALFGLRAPELEECRVLELGCGNGSNLVPMAAAMPRAQFVGVDLAATPIAHGRERAARLGLSNLRLEQGDVSRLGPDLGRFDYVTAHGLYSWVPAAVRPHVLRVAGEVLSDDGVAYVSYNALPGCRLRHLVRELVRMHFGTTAFEPGRIAEVRAFLAEVARVEAARDGEFLGALQREIAFVQSLPDAVLYHDDLAQESHAFLLTELLEDARPHGLQYLGEAGIAEMYTLAGFPDFDRMLADWSGGDRVRREQHLDFVRGRRFRQTLLCRAHHRLAEDAGPRSLRAMHLRASLRAEPGAALFDRSEVRFSDGSRGARVDEPIAKAALARLAARWPDTVAFDALLGGAMHDCAASGLAYDETAGAALAALLWSMVRADLVEPLRDAPPPAAPPGAQPRLRAVVADALAHGLVPADTLNRGFRLDDPIARRLAAAMDGTRGRDALLALAREAPAMRSGGTATAGGSDPAPDADAAPGADAAPDADAAARLERLIAFLHGHGAFAG